jgi:hypothetical protein
MTELSGSVLETLREGGEFTNGVSCRPRPSVRSTRSRSILSLTKGTRGAFTGLEKACLILSGLGILLWATTGSARLALVASVSAACIGGVPTVVKAWAKPWTEPMSGWLLMLLGTVFGALAIQEWTFDSGLVPVAIGLFQLSVALPLVLYTLKGGLPQFRSWMPLPHHASPRG